MRVSAIAVLVALAVATGCGTEENGSAETTTAAETTETTTTETTVASGDPLTCLEEAGLTDVEERASDLWRGYHEGPFYQVTVQLLSSRADARALVRDAVDVYAAEAGEYVVTGPATPAAGGLVNSDEAVEANALVRDVASCLS